MRDFLKKYTITLTTQGPLYIGSGETITKKEYIFIKEEKRIIIPDTVKMQKYLLQQPLPQKSLPQEPLYIAYENFLMDESKRNLYQWLNENNIPKKEYIGWKKYVLNCMDVDMDNKTNNISTFVKDAYMSPYVPGSSMKGVLRTVLLTEKLFQDPNLKKEVQEIISANYKVNEANRDKRKKINRKTYLKQQESLIEEKVFHTLHIKDTKRSDAVNDNMKGIIVGDSKPLETSDLILCRKKDVRIKDGKENTLPILKECIKPHVKIEIPLTIDTSISPYNVDMIKKAIEDFSMHYSDYLRMPKDENKDVIYLGGGVGFTSKTFLDKIYIRGDAVRIISYIIDQTLPEKVRSLHKHSRDVEVGVSPHTRKYTKYKNTLYGFGKCKFEIREE